MKTKTGNGTESENDDRNVRKMEVRMKMKR
jgi:hypothetical protein